MRRSALAHGGNFPPRTRNRGEEVPGEAPAILSGSYMSALSDRELFLAERPVGGRLCHHRRNPAAGTVSHLRPPHIRRRSAWHPQLQ